MRTVTDPRTPTPRLHASDRRLQLIETALDFFSRKGFSGTTTKEIAAAAGVTEAIIFRHFPSKQDLYNAVLDHHHESCQLSECIAQWKSCMDRNDDKGLIRAIIERVIEGFRKDLRVHRVLMFAVLEGHEAAQSALLECMEERQVTVDGTTYPLDRPFMVIATQNPVEMEGTYPLPEAQRDRFTARISMGYPSPEAELAMLDIHGSSSPLETLKPVATAGDVRELISAVRRVHVAAALKQYVIALVGATRSAPDLRLGASPRAALHLLRASRARAALDGRDFVIPDDVQALAGPVLAHRLLPTAEAMVERQFPERVLAAIVEQV